ncbi:hypothetical protein [Natrinema altunense]|uniref:Restriction endonuclease type IV Mrr domain-containing protein n=1 Tax=Natrinema altunense TaxID=222984 RepID=A0A482XV02_9EURY|nr:hypothetical protein [Natrinema altunense]RZH67188.1 hypothetical protein ELS17_15690 [Natrinema altunense]
MTDWVAEFDQLGDENPESDFEDLVRKMVTEKTGYSCKKQKVLGRSGNHYEVDAVPMIEGRQNKRYLHLINVKDTKVAETNRSTWYNHVDRAHARLDEVGGDFLPKTIVVKEFADIGDRSFKAEFASVGARVIDIGSFGALIEEVNLFADKPSLFTKRPRLDYYQS